MDDIDRRILASLQRDATRPVADVAAQAGLSTTPCWRRIQNLEKSGVIQRRVALLDPVKVNVGVTVFVRVKTSQHNPDWLDRFATGVSAIEEVVDFYRLSGDIDYLLRVVVPDIAAYDAVYKRLIAVAELADVSSSFAMETLKHTTVVPVRYAR
jgi:Lrp/AsnC family transcriptional regulator, cysteine-sensing transcriptional activator